MKNQEIKGKPGLTLEKLGENELEIITAGTDSGCGLFGSFVGGFLCGVGFWPLTITIGPFIIDDNTNNGYFYAGVLAAFIPLEAAYYVIYKIGSAVVRKLKRKPVDKVDSDKKSVVPKA